MDTFQAIRTRRSVKRFDPDHAMAEDDLRQLMELTILSPTSYNVQNWRFVVVTDPDVKARLRAAGRDQAQFTDASLVVMICGDRLAWTREPERYWANAAPEKRAVIVPKLVKAFQDDPQKRRDENLRSGSLAAQTLMLAARALGYDTCPMVGFDFAEAGRIIALPADHDIVMAVAVGRALEPARPRGGQLPLDAVVFRDRFGAG